MRRIISSRTVSRGALTARSRTVRSNTSRLSQGKQSRSGHARRAESAVRQQGKPIRPLPHSRQREFLPHARGAWLSAGRAPFAPPYFHPPRLGRKSVAPPPWACASILRARENLNRVAC